MISRKMTKLFLQEGNFIRNVNPYIQKGEPETRSNQCLIVEI